MAWAPRRHEHLAGRLNDWSFDDVLAAARREDGAAYAQLWMRYAGPLTVFVRSRGAEEPDEVVNDAFASVFSRLPSFSGDEEGFRALIYTVARRRVVDERRRRGRRPATRPWDAGDDRAGLQADLGTSADDLRDLLLALTEDQREVIVLRVVADLDVARIAQITGRRQGAVKALQRRALRTLREQLSAPADEGASRA